MKRPEGQAGTTLLLPFEHSARSQRVALPRGTPIYDTMLVILNDSYQLVVLKPIAYRGEV